LADFGTYCSENNYFDKPFGTRYYQAPEIILMGKCSYPVDIWALGCTFYELLTGKLLFDPIKDSKYSRDYYHLCLINDTCGKFPSHFLKKTKFYNNFFNSSYNIINQNNKLNEQSIKVFNDLSDSDNKIVFSILTQMLEIDPIKRINILNLSKHTFFM
jgi:serine/threonine protein kinase